MGRGYRDYGKSGMEMRTDVSRGALADPTLTPPAELVHWGAPSDVCPEWLSQVPRKGEELQPRV